MEKIFQLFDILCGDVLLAALVDRMAKDARLKSAAAQMANNPALMEILLAISENPDLQLIVETVVNYDGGAIEKPEQRVQRVTDVLGGLVDVGFLRPTDLTPATKYLLKEQERDKRLRGDLKRISRLHPVKRFIRRLLRDLHQG